MANFTDNMTQLQSLLDRVSALPSENEYLDEINAINGGTPAVTMNTAVSNTETSVSEEADLINQIVIALATKAAPSILSATMTPSSNSTSISFSGLSGEPKMFAICPTGNITLGSTRYVTGVVYDGTTTHGTYGYRSNYSATSYYSASYFTWTYNNETLTVSTSSSTNGGNFTSNITYKLIYITAVANDTPQIILQSKIVTPTANAQTITPDNGYTGLSQVTINGDSDLVASNIRSGKNIFGVTGSLNEGVTVQRATGTFRKTEDDVIITCGFRPDMIMIHSNVGDDSSNVSHVAIAFYEEARNYAGIYYTLDAGEGFYVGWAYVGDYGFLIKMSHLDNSFNWGTVDSNTTFYYTAVKYT